MKTDSLNRRIRFEPPSAVSKGIVLTEAEYLIFEAINRHGPLPTHYLFEFIRPIRKNYANFQYRLTQLYNGDHGGPYLFRPPQQFAAYNAHCQHIVYDLTPRAKAVLAERGVTVAAKRADAFLHQLMGACVAASIEIVARWNGLRYIPRAEILAHEKCPRHEGNPMAIPLSEMGSQKFIVPDDLFGIEYPGAGFRFFAVEIDRNTESIERKNLDQNSFGKKIAGYFEILRNRTYQAHFGLPNLTVLTVTTNATHGRNILDYVKKHGDQQFEGRFAVTSDASFGANWRVPRSLLVNLLDQPWATTSEPKHINRP
jgi:hypothetical protein